MITRRYLIELFDPGRPFGLIGLCTPLDMGGTVVSDCLGAWYDHSQSEARQAIITSSMNR